MTFGGDPHNSVYGAPHKRDIAQTMTGDAYALPVRPTAELLTLCQSR